MAESARRKQQRRDWWRRRHGWDGVSPWVPKFFGRPVRYPVMVSTMVRQETKDQLAAIARRERISVAQVARDALESYLADVMEELK